MSRSKPVENVIPSTGWTEYKEALYGYNSMAAEKRVWHHKNGKKSYL